MSTDLLITLAIGLVATGYVVFIARRSARKLLNTSRGTGSACGSCSGCGTSKGHAENEESCTERDSLVVLGKKSQ